MHELLMGARDSMGNQATQRLAIHIDHPEIRITDVTAITDDLASITAELNQDIDEGVVQFERNIRGIRDLLATDQTEQTDRPV